MKRNKIIRFWIVVLLLLVVEALALSTGWWGPRLFPGCYVSDLYRRYEHADGIRASFLKDYRVNDTLCLDVTLLEATTDAGWDTLQAHFRILQLPDYLEQKIANGEDKVTVRFAPKDSPSQPTDTTELTNNFAIAISRLYRTVSIFHAHTLKEMDAVCISKYGKPY